MKRRRAHSREARPICTRTSIRPGRMSASSSFSRKLVVMKSILPSCAATPSRALRSPEKLTPVTACASRRPLFMLRSLSRLGEQDRVARRLRHKLEELIVAQLLARQIQRADYHVQLARQRGDEARLRCAGEAEKAEVHCANSERASICVNYWSASPVRRHSCVIPGPT
eukprot:4313935-Pleurochrysis_carterae.AAC.3